jgi:hypothetical protein
MGYGTRPHEWKTDELESMETHSLTMSTCVSCLFCMTQPIVAGQHERHADMSMAILGHYYSRMFHRAIGFWVFEPIVAVPTGHSREAYSARMFGLGHGYTAITMGKRQRVLV